MVEITGIDEPLEIRIAFPAFHSRTKRLKDVKPIYEEKYGVERTGEILRLVDKVHWGINQHYKDEGGKRVVSYVPEVLKDIYNRELGEVAQEK